MSFWAQCDQLGGRQDTQKRSMLEASPQTRELEEAVDEAKHQMIMFDFAATEISSWTMMRLVTIYTHRSQTRNWSIYIV